MKKFLSGWRRTIFFGLIILILALGLRFYNLNLLPVFGDEAIYIRWAQIMKVEPGLRFVPLSDGKQPLFMWSIIPFLKIISDPLFAGRAVSVMTGLGSLLGVFALTFYLFKSKKLALIAGLIYAISPFSFFFDRMALVDSMLTMFGVWTLLGAVFIAKTLRPDVAMLTGFALGGALLTKSPALFFVLLLPTTVLLTDWPKNKKKRLIHLGKLVSLWTIVLIIAYGMYNILRLGPNFHMVGARNQDYVFPISHLWENPKDPFIFRPKEIFNWFWLMGPSVLVFLVPLGIYLGWKSHKKQILTLMLWGFLPILVQAEYAKVFTVRYILFSVPPLFILAAAGFLAKPLRLKRILEIGLIIFILHSLTLNFSLLTQPERAKLPRVMRSGYLEEWTAGYGIREVAGFLRNEWAQRPEGQIVVGTEGFFGTLPDGLQIYVNDLRDITVIGLGQPIKSVPKSLLDSKKAGNRTYFVVNSSRFLGDPEGEGLELLAAYPKAFRLEGTREYNTLGPRDTLLFFEVTKKSITPKPRTK